ncbi:MAG TPA: PQQ-binding-like beta-propeller repeat protein [Gemmataceae bacterium]|jgi:outer membrane protein assembly factor BamB|nr:PQQ-binding-like beta-propeller repeat protein [Gemmataceae bacterium]
MRILVALLLLAIPAVADDWPQYLGPQRDGIWRETGIVDKFPASGPPILWRMPCGMGYAGPAVTQGKVFLPDRVLSDSAKNPDNPFQRVGVEGVDRLLCLDEKTGEQVWKVEHKVEYRVSYAAGPRCTPTVDGDMLYWLDTMGDLFALETKTGKQVWKKNFKTDFGGELPVWGYSCHPLVDGDRLICLIGGAEGRGVVAFNKKTGDIIWKALTIPGDPGYNSPVIFEVNGKRVLIIWHTHAVVGLDPETGKKLWQHDWEVSNALTVPTVRLVNKTLLFMTGFYAGSTLLDIGGDSPKVVWKSKSKGNESAVNPRTSLDLHSIMPTPWIKDGTIYGICSYGELRGLELMTGKRLWETHAPTGGVSARWANAFIIPHDNGERVFLFNEKGELIIAKLSPKGYDEIDRVTIIDPTNKYAAGRTVVWAHPAFADQTIFARNDKEVVAVSLRKAK